MVVECHPSPEVVEEEEIEVVEEEEVEVVEEEELVVVEVVVMDSNPSPAVSHPCQEMIALVPAAAAAVVAAVAVIHSTNKCLKSTTKSEECMEHHLSYLTKGS